LYLRQVMRRPSLVWPLLCAGLGWGLGCGELLGEVEIGDAVTTSYSSGAEPGTREVVSQPLPLQPSGAVGPSGCVEGCLPRLCDAGQTRCLGGLLESCDLDSGNWRVVDACATPELCEIGRTTTGMQCEAPRCGTAERICEGQLLRACNSGHTGWVDAQTCTDEERCDPRLGCTALPCSFGERRCNGARIEVCDSRAEDFIPTADAPCATAQLCSEGPDGVGCVEPLCAVGEFRCEGTLLQRCSEGRDSWVDFQRCATPELCDPERKALGCNEPSCEAGARSCLGAQPQSCPPGRTGFVNAGPACASAALCNPQQGTCTPPACAAGEAECDGRDTLLSCNADRTGFVATACGRGERCRNDSPAECR
jgi:hypothetical protein